MTARRRGGAWWRRIALPSVLLVILTLPAILSLPAAGHAQSPLAAVDSLARSGDADGARTLLMRWWEGDRARPTRADLQRAIWLRALLTVDPDQAALDYRRLVVEYPAGQHTDDALLRLARLAEARGRVVEAAQHMEALRRDHPSSPHSLAASQWLSENAAAVRNARAMRPPPASERPTERVRPPRGVPEPETELFAVQFGAFASPEGAARELERVRAAGFDARQVRVEGSELIRVRAGRFTDAAAATRVYDRARRVGLDVTVVADAARELPPDLPSERRPVGPAP